jgi:hypothetical protein
MRGMRLFSAVLAFTVSSIPAASQAAWLDHVEQRVQDSLHEDGLQLSSFGYALELASTSSTSVRVRLTRTDGGPEPERTIENVPRDLDAAAVEVGIAVVSMLPKHDAPEPEPEPAPVRTQHVPDQGRPALDASPPPAKPGSRLTEEDRYFIGLSFSIAVGFGSGHYIADAPKGWLFTALDLAAATTGVIGTVRVANGHRKGGDIGLIIGGAVGFLVFRVWQMIDLLTFDPAREDG